MRERILHSYEKRCKEAKKHFWFQPEWLEVLTFLAGLVDDATPLIEAVEEEQKKDDLFGSMLYLKARLVGVAREANVRAGQRACAGVFLFWRKILNGGRDCLREFALPMIATLTANITARDILAGMLLGLTRDESEEVREVAAEALGHIGAEQAVDRLLGLTRDKSPFVCRAAAKALWQMAWK